MRSTSCTDHFNIFDNYCTSGASIRPYFYRFLLIFFPPAVFVLLTPSLQSDAGPWLFVSTILSRLTARDRNPATLPHAHRERSHSMRQKRNRLVSRNLNLWWITIWYFNASLKELSIFYSPPRGESKVRAGFSVLLLTRPCKIITLFTVAPLRANNTPAESYFSWLVCTRREVGWDVQITLFCHLHCLGFFLTPQSAAEGKLSGERAKAKGVTLCICSSDGTTDAWIKVFV